MRTSSIELSHPTRARGDPRLAETRGMSRTVYGILCERHTAGCQEGINGDTQALMRSTRSSVMGKIIAVPAGQDKKSWLFDPQTSAACPRTSTDVKLSLKIGISHSGVFRWTNPNGGQNGGQTHSQAKRGSGQPTLLILRLRTMIIWPLPNHGVSAQPPSPADNSRPANGSVGSPQLLRSSSRVSWQARPCRCDR